MSQPTSNGQEQTVAHTQVMVNVVTAYEKVRLSLTRQRLHADWPVAVLGVVPLRRTTLAVRLAGLRSIRLVRAVFPTRLLVAALLAFVTVFFDMPLVATVLFVAAAVLFLLLSIVAAVRIEADDGDATIPVCWLQRRRAIEFIETVTATSLRENGRSR